MGLIYENTSFTDRQAQTHALVIGVNDYPHLRNGKEFSIAPARFTMGLGQLTSPVISAKLFANWLIKKHRNPDAPLGTVELLISSPTEHRLLADNAPIASKLLTDDAAIALKLLTADAPTWTNIKAAFDRWEKRCNKLEENVAFFYYCGHGVEYQPMILLAKDFGKDPNLPWDNAINFDMTFYGMGECKAQSQCYFIDACRDPDLEAIKGKSVSLRPLKTTQLTYSPRRAAPVLKAAAPGKKATGRANDVSFFTEELIKCFDGLGASHRVGSIWKVTPESITARMVKQMERQGFSCDSAMSQINIPLKVIHLIDDPARCMVQIICLPSAALGVADLFMINRQVNPTREYKRKPHNAPWELDVETGEYDVKAKFQNKEYKEASKDKQLVHPPIYECNLEV